MPTALEEAMAGAQQEYRRIIALLGHSRAQRLGFQKDEEDYEKELLVIIKKIRNYEAQTPKSEGKSNVESSSSTESGDQPIEPQQNSN